MAQTRSRREYLQLLDASKVALESAVDAYNRVWHSYRDQTTLLLLANAWELLAKAVLVQKKESIVKGQRGETISAETAIHRLLGKKLIQQAHADTVQQIISLRNEACHNVLPEVEIEIMHHLLYYGCKFFRELVGSAFPSHLKDMRPHYLSMSFSDMTTYADKVQKTVSSVKKSGNAKRLAWLLERGIAFDGTAYITEAQFEQKYRGKKKILPHLGLNRFLRSAEMVRIVAVEAPRNYTADLSLRKGSAADASLPVLIKKTDLEADYPFLTKELGAQIGKGQSWVALAAGILGLKGNPKFHQAVRASAKSLVHRYSNAAVDAIRQKLAQDPAFNPYHPTARASAAG